MTVHFFSAPLCICICLPLHLLIKLVDCVQPAGGRAADVTNTGHDVDYTTAVDVTDLESVLSGASGVSWTSFLDWDEVDRLIAEDN